MNPIEKQVNKPRVHRILAHSYMVYLFALVLGLICSAMWPIKIFEDNILLGVSFVVLVFSSVLVLWAQNSTKNFYTENLTKQSFTNGPYRLTRNPTNLGIFFSSVSFGIIISSPFVLIFTLVAFLLSRLIFLKQEERILEKKYGKPYLDYKEMVKF